MATADIQMPAVHVRVPPWTKVDKLYTPSSNDRILKVRDATDFAPANTYRNREEGRPVARVISLHHGYLPNEFAKEVHGAVTAGQRKLWTGSGSQSWFKRQQTDIMAELYGAGSFLHAYVLGESSYEDCVVAITNWNLDARKCAVVPAGEQPAAQAERRSNQQAYLNAIRTLQKKVQDAYVAAHIAAGEQINDPKTPGDVRARAIEGKKLYAELMRVSIQPAYPTSHSFAHVAEIEDAKLQFVFCREEEERFDFWDSKINGHVIATMFRQARHTADLGTFLRDPIYSKMWSNRLELTCDAMHRYIIARENLRQQLQVLSSDVGVRLSFKLKSRRSEVYSFIYRLNSSFPASEYGTWLDVPLIPSRGVVRDADTATLPLPDRVLKKRNRTSLF